ncbi:MAG: dCTP deaminase domain-containing protein [Candidatus Thorarchaeota archaeon]
MKILTKVDIEKLGSKLISPFEESCLTPVGYDLRVGEKVILLTESKEERINESRSISIPPGERFALESLEKVFLPEDMFALICTRISLAWRGLTNLGTKVDPKFNDKLVLIFSNDSSQPIELRHKERICNIMFFRYRKPPPGIDPRGRPSFLVIPSFPPPIEDPIVEEDIRKRYGYGIFSLIRYLKPKLKDYEDRLKKLEGMRKKIYAILTTLSTAIIAGVILWVLKVIFGAF